MKFKESIKDVIKMRTSCRTYDSHGIEDEIVQKLNDFIEEINLEAKDKARFIIINQNSKYNNTTQNLGTYGTKGYGLASYDIQKNDIGIAMCHFELTAKELGLGGR